MFCHVLFGFHDFVGLFCSPFSTEKKKDDVFFWGLKICSILAPWWLQIMSWNLGPRSPEVGNFRMTPTQLFGRAKLTWLKFSMIITVLGLKKSQSLVGIILLFHTWSLYVIQQAPDSIRHRFILKRRGSGNVYDSTTFEFGSRDFTFQIGQFFFQFWIMVRHGRLRDKGQSFTDCVNCVVTRLYDTIKVQVRVKTTDCCGLCDNY